jgi:nucleoside-diphosphate-sugar epimerase
MKCVVTGAAGFIGSHLCEHLLTLGHEVAALDAFIPYYPRAVKEGNLTPSLASPVYRFIAADLREAALEPVLEGADVVFHLAAMPGLVASWDEFDLYLTCNVLATRRLLEAVCRAAPRLKRFVYASTSSVYGRFASGDETLPTRPISPYGVTKLAGEQLCRSYAEAYGLPLVVMRYFSVYGPRQRPDMAYHRFMKALLLDQPIVVYDDGQQVRGNTFVDDCVEATVLGVDAVPGEVFNVGGGEAVSLLDVLAKLERLSGRRFKVRHESARPGDQRHTFADTSKLRRHLHWEPRTRLDDGLARQWAWHEATLRRTAAA